MQAYIPTSGAGRPRFLCCIVISCEGDHLHSTLSFGTCLLVGGGSLPRSPNQHRADGEYSGKDEESAEQGGAALRMHALDALCKMLFLFDCHERFVAGVEARKILLALSALASSSSCGCGCACS